MDKINTGVVGTGGWGRVLTNAAAANPRFNIIGCYDIRKESRAEFAQEYGCAECSSLEELYEMNGISAVINATANHVHAETTIKAARCGLNVFVEKPISNTVADGKRMIEECEKAGVVLFVGHCDRRHARYRKMHELISSGRLGRPLMVEANMSHGGSRTTTPEQWRGHRATCPATPMMQLGIHAIDTVHYLLGRTVAAGGMLAQVGTKLDMDDVTMGLMEFESGARGYIGACYSIPNVNYINIYLSEGNLYTQEIDDCIFYRDFKVKQRTPIEFQPVQPTEEEIEEFALCCLGEKKPETGGAEGLAALAVVEAIIQSASEGGAMMNIKM